MYDNAVKQTVQDLNRVLKHGGRCEHASIYFSASLRVKKSKGRLVEDRCNEAIAILQDSAAM